jgi:hypothetical protein
MYPFANYKHSQSKLSFHYSRKDDAKETMLLLGRLWYYNNDINLLQNHIFPSPDKYF